MTVCASGKASPGTTTAAWALSLGWPGPLLTVDADPAGGDMAPGMLCGRITMERSLVTWSAAARRDTPVLTAAGLLAEHAVLIPEAPQVWFVPGFLSAVQAEAFTSATWVQLGKALEKSNAGLGRDALVDAGRIIDARGPWPLFAVADLIVLTVRPTVRSVLGAREAAARIVREIGDLRRVALLVTGAGPYAPDGVAGELGLPLLGVLPEDRPAAQHLSDGIALGARQSLAKSALLKAASGIAQRITAADPAVYPPAEVSS